jgi:hypothetical protein
MYAERAVPGAGLGCLALRPVLPGELVLREAPQLVVGQGAGSVLLRTIRAFSNMTAEDQERYLGLSNMFDKDTALWSETARNDMVSMEAEMENMEFSEIARSDVIRVWQIRMTNSFHNGVCLKMSRFNHSCRPNAEYFWNRETGTRDARAVREIGRGEEITLGYRQMWTLTREERRRSLKENFNFDCCCEACDITEEEAEREARDCEQFKALNKERQAITGSSTAELQQEMNCLKSMYILANDMGIIKKSLILRFIIEECFDVLCQCLIYTEDIPTDKIANFSEDAKYFSSLGFQISTMLYGKDHTVTCGWKSRQEDPVGYFKKEYLQSNNI